VVRFETRRVMLIEAFQARGRLEVDCLFNEELTLKGWIKGLSYVVHGQAIVYLRWRVVDL
jgi:hypothetical protein